jgi:hypothetical protein
MTLPLSDSLVAPLLTALRDCVCAQLEATPLGATCRCMIVHSFTLATMDGCGCGCDAGQGDAWVRLVRLEPDGLVGGLGSTNCPTGWQAIVELGVYRCVPVSEEGEALPQQTVTDTALNMLADMNALIRVLACCDTLDDRDVSVDFWQPVGPAGSCAGGTLQIRVALPGGPPGAC